MQASPIRLRGERLLLDPGGAVLLPDHDALVVADLHLEKGSAFARRGALLPPYDTAATLERLRLLVERYRPAILVSLGDAFHDRAGPEAAGDETILGLRALAAGRRFVWVRGNHDPQPPCRWCGEATDVLRLGSLSLRHLPGAGAHGEIAGHLHPKVRLSGTGRTFTTRCFVRDECRLLMPAFGSFTGGLNLLHESIRTLFPTGFETLALGERRVFSVPHERLVAEQPDWRRHRSPDERRSRVRR